MISLNQINSKSIVNNLDNNLEEINEEINTTLDVNDDSTLKVEKEYYCTNEELKKINLVIGISPDSENLLYLKDNLELTSPIVFKNVKIIGMVIARDGKEATKSTIKTTGSGAVKFENVTIENCIMTGRILQNKKTDSEK